MLRVLLTGAQGQLGCELMATQPDHLTVMALSRQQLDITSSEQVNAVMAQFQPHYVINAAAYNAVDAAEQNQQAADAVNVTGVRNLVEAVSRTQAFLLHISTDYVFDGHTQHPYAPSSMTHPLNVYGSTKLAGEQLIQNSVAERSLILRTSWVYSCYQQNFVKKMLTALQEQEILRMAQDQVSAPTWAKNLARFIWSVITKNQQNTGIYHFTDEGSVSKYQFTAAIQAECLALGLFTRKIPVIPIKAREFPALAQRPAYSVLDCSKTWRDFACTPMSWQHSLHQMLVEWKHLMVENHHV